MPLGMLSFCRRYGYINYYYYLYYIKMSFYTAIVGLYMN